MKNRILYLLTILISYGSFAQVKLSGKVTDATGAAISTANIYLYNSKQGTITNEFGEFHLSSIPKGKHILQASHVGYENLILSFDLVNDTSLIISLSPSLIQLKEVVVLGTESKANTSFNVAQLDVSNLSNVGSFSISDAMAKMPGMSQLTTGVGISKPVIRGLYGNRIQVNVNGLRFDNQQWQDEHGLGLSDLGIEKIEVIKGPSSVLYGSDAMGGVLNIIDEKPAPINETRQDITFKYFSNTYGASLNYGLKKSNEKSWWKFRGGFDNHADYSNNKNGRVLNSRFASYNLKGSVGFNRKNRNHILNMYLSSSKFGFVFDSLDRKEDDGRLSRTFDGPHHQVLFAQLNSENTFYKNHKKIKVNAGVTSNLRQEDEGGEGISLSMLLNTLSMTTQINQQIGQLGEWIYGVSGMFQTNTNFGGRTIVPDAMTGELSAFTYYNYSLNKWLVEGGIRYDRKFIATYATGNINVVGADTPTEEIFPFNNFYNALNASVGTVYNFSDQFNIKANASSGYRPGNLAELSSNGLHEGTLRWEIGNPNAKIEQNVNVEASLNYETSTFKASVSAYHNQFYNYIYLAPTGTEFFGFQVYRFQQDDAIFKGGELQITYIPTKSPLEINCSYSQISGKKSAGGYLPFVPANKVNSSISWHFKSGAKLSNPVIKIGSDYAFKQAHPSEFETQTSDYFLLSIGASATIKKIDIALQANNVLNKSYYDHLSRFKYFGIYNIGLNTTLSINYKF